MISKAAFAAAICLGCAISSESFADSFQIRNPTNEIIAIQLNCGPGNKRDVQIQPRETQVVEISDCTGADYVAASYHDEFYNFAGVFYPSAGKKYVGYLGWTQSWVPIYYFDDDKGQTPECWFQFRGSFPRNADGSCPVPSK